MNSRIILLKKRRANAGDQKSVFKNAKGGELVYPRQFIIHGNFRVSFQHRLDGFKQGLEMWRRAVNGKGIGVFIFFIKQKHGRMPFSLVKTVYTG